MTLKFYVTQIIFMFIILFLFKHSEINNDVEPQIQFLKWEGEYSLEFSHKRKYALPMFWKYKILVYNKNCRFQISGFQIEQDYLCNLKVVNDTLYFLGIEDIQYHVDSIRNRIVFKIYKRGLNYYTTKEYKPEEADEKPTKFGYKIKKISGSVN